jgi:hypothetical protein
MREQCCSGRSKMQEPVNRGPRVSNVRAQPPIPHHCVPDGYQAILPLESRGVGIGKRSGWRPEDVSDGKLLKCPGRNNKVFVRVKLLKSWKRMKADRNSF